MTDDVASACVRIFKEITGLKNTREGAAREDSDILSAPFESFDIDSLETMEFVMAVEDHFGILLNEEAVNGCNNIAHLAELVAMERRV
jgi:acyl carrier protein